MGPSSVIRDVRDVVGMDFTLMVDVQYAFPDADTCLAAIRDWREFDLQETEAHARQAKPWPQ